MENDVIVVTGGASGIGFAAAKALGQNGTTILSDVNAAQLERASVALRADGMNVVIVQGDLTQPSAVAALVDETCRRGRLRALVHAAGISASMALPLRILDVNLRAAVRIEEAFRSIANPSSVAVFVASIAAHRDHVMLEHIAALLRDALRPSFMDEIGHAVDGAAAYRLAKWALRHHVERSCRAWAEKGARIVSVSPGFVETPMAEFEKGRNVYATDGRSAGAPLGRSARGEEIGTAISFLCSDGASYITGCDLLVDGGLIGDTNSPATSQ